MCSSRIGGHALNGLAELLRHFVGAIGKGVKEEVGERALDIARGLLSEFVGLFGGGALLLNAFFVDFDQGIRQLATQLQFFFQILDRLFASTIGLCYRQGVGQSSLGDDGELRFGQSVDFSLIFGDGY